MGAWGIAISSNDTYADIYGKFFELYNDGLDVVEISTIIISENQSIVDEIECGNNFWFALAKAQWECKQLDKVVFDKVKSIIETGADLQIWEELGASGKDIEKRKVVLDKFLSDLERERPKAKRRKKEIVREPVFVKGDCLTFKLANGNYGGVVVLEAVQEGKNGYNLIATTSINQQRKPTKEDFENAEVLMENYDSSKVRDNLKWYLPIRHEKMAPFIEKVERIEVQINYDINNSMFGFIADFDVYIIKAIDQQIETYLKTKKTIKELTKKNKWKFLKLKFS